MAKDPKLLLFAEAKEDTLENIEAIKLNLARCVEEGMIDFNDTYYNELVDLEDEVNAVDNWEELIELTLKAKTLEIDIAAFLSLHGHTSLSLPWPKKPSTF
ncbi:MAG: hypothetical protein V4487_04775 [Chlamydiota bacterium]